MGGERMSRMKSFAMGLMMGLEGHPLPRVAGEATSYFFDPGNGVLTIYQDDGSLSYNFSDESLHLTVSEV